MQHPLIIILGATGNLAKLKLLPALDALYKKKKLNAPILCLGRQSLTKQTFIHRSRLAQGDKHFLQHSNYLALSDNLREEIKKLHTTYKTGGNTILYLALPATAFNENLELLQKAGVFKGLGYKRIALEKPFGLNLASARKLNKQLHKHFKEEHIYRVDHYLGKEMVENIPLLKTGNTLFKNVWDERHIESIQLILSENQGIHERGVYYDQTGAIRDVVQNHLLQVLALTLAHITKFDHAIIQREKARVITSLVPPTSKEIVRGQYQHYTREKEVTSRSKTESFVAFKTRSRLKQWNSVPIYVKTGKKLNEHHTTLHFALRSKDTSPERISIRLSPHAGITIHYEIKKPGKVSATEANLEFSEGKAFEANTPDAYEEIITALIENNKLFFTSWSEVEASWKFIDKLRKNALRTPLHIYKQGSVGPKEADTLLKRDRRSWFKG